MHGLLYITFVFLHHKLIEKESPMAKPAFVLILALLNLKFSAQGQPSSWIGIDCGSNTTTNTSGITWQTDENFIKTGTNHYINNSLQLQTVFNTLRAFTDQNKNCYTLPVDTGTYSRYFIRAGFLYANYDGKSSPPSFDLEIDGNKWTSVVTSSSSDYTYYEILYGSLRDEISVCLARTQSQQFPFISSLEAWPVNYLMYAQMSLDYGWMKTFRYSYGSNIGVSGYLDGDNYNRIWEVSSVSGSVNTTGVSSADCNENPPMSVVKDAVQAPDSASSLTLSFGPFKMGSTIYIEAYFTSMGTYDVFKMYVGGEDAGPVTPIFLGCTSIPPMEVLSSNLTVELQPYSSTLPSFISAIEIYTATDPLTTTGTDQNDLSGVKSFVDTYDRLKGWSGEPCLPADTVWEWLACSVNQPPRVTALYLSGYQLNGTLFSFSQMQALVNIDLSRNNLSGEIPAFLGQLPYLRTLNLSYNDFSGLIPASILNNRRLKYDITGNPNLAPSSNNGSSKSTIIGLAVGIPLLLVIILLLAFWVIRRRAKPSQGQETVAETGNGDESFTATGASMAQQHVQPNLDVEEVKPNEESMVPDMDLDELEELIDQYANDGVRQEEVEEEDDDDCVPVGEQQVAIYESNDESMVPDLDLEELHEIIRQEKERADEVGRP